MATRWTMSGMSPLRLAKSAVVSGFVGGTAGVVINTWRRDKERLKQLSLYAATAGVSGLVAGYVFASIRHRNTTVYSHALSFGGSFFAIAGTFLVFRDKILIQFGRGGKQLYPSESPDTNVHVLSARQPVSPMFASAISGGLTGLILSSVFMRSAWVIVTNSIQGIGLGVLGQFTYDKFRTWRLEKVLQYNYPELTGNAPKVQQDIQLEEKLHWSESLMRFLKTKTYSSQVDGQIRNLEIQLDLLEEEEKRLHSKLAAQDKRS